MKFTIKSAEELWSAVSRVMKATPRRTMGSELNAMCFEANESGLYVHRYSSDAYAEHKVEAEISEFGKVIVSDAEDIQTMTGQTIFEVVENDLVGTNAENPAWINRLRLSTTDPFLFTRTRPDGIETKPLSIDLSRDILWVSKGDKFLYDWILFDGSDIVVSNSTMIVLIDNGKVISEEPIFVKSDFFLAFKKDSKIGIGSMFGNRKIWVVEDNFLYCNSDIKKSYKSGMYRQVVENALKPENTKLTLDKSTLSQIISSVGNVSQDNVFRNGFCQIEYIDNELLISSVNSQFFGQIVRTVPVLSAEGKLFKVRSYPNYIRGALDVIEDDVFQVTLELWYSEQHKGYATVIHSDKVYNLIPCAAWKGEE